MRLGRHIGAFRLKSLNLMIIWFAFNLTLTANADATLVNVNISGNLTSVLDVDSLLDGSILVGGAFSGSFSYDSSLADTVSDPTVFSSGGLSSSITSVMTVGNYTFQASSGTSDLQNQSTDTLHFLLPYTSNPFIDLGSNPGRAIFLNFSDNSGTVFFDDVLPSNLNLNNFSSNSITFFGDSGPGNPLFSAGGTITSISTPSTSIPEPGTLALFVIGLAGLGFMRRKGILR